MNGADAIAVIANEALKPWCRLLTVRAYQKRVWILKLPHLALSK